MGEYVFTACNRAPRESPTINHVHNRIRPMCRSMRVAMMPPCSHAHAIMHERGGL